MFFQFKTNLFATDHVIVFSFEVISYSSLNLSYFHSELFRISDSLSLKLSTENEPQRDYNTAFIEIS